jgi:signal transduction histidine kinase
MLKRSNHNLLAMVQNLIEVYRYEAGETILSKEPLSLYDLINNSLEEMNAWAAERQITFRVKVPPPATIMADRLAIRRVFLNLVDNALKFTKAGGKITISTEETNNHVELKVTDTGVGISESELPLLFSRFYQTESGRRRAMGSGLGLYLCRQIITAHGGTIGALSKLDHGTTFIIKFPKESQSIPSI